MQTLAERLKATRKKRRMPVSVPAQAVLVSHSTLDSWERGKTCPTCEQVRLLARLYLVEPAWLAFGEPHDPRPAWLDLPRRRTRPRPPSAPAPTHTDILDSEIQRVAMRGLG